jgi:hypothetical protein
MIAEVLEEFSVLLETRVEPGELGRRELAVSSQISGISHGVKVIGGR